MGEMADISIDEGLLAPFYDEWHGMQCDECGREKEYDEQQGKMRCAHCHPKTEELVHDE